MSNKKKISIIETDDLIYVWRIFTKNWYILLTCILLAFVVSYFYTYKLKEVYAAQSQILLKNNETYDYQSQIYKGLGYYYNSPDNSNQIRVITSNDLINKTLSRLKFDVSYFIVGRLKTTEVFDAMPFVVSAQVLDYSLFESDFKLKIINEKQYEISYSKEGSTIVKKGNFSEPIQETDFFITIKKNELLNNETINSLKSIDYVFKVHDVNTLISKYKSSISIENLENTTILELTLEDGIPSRAVTFLDTLSKEYIQYTAQAQITVNSNTLDNIDKQLKEITIILNGIEDNMESYKSDKAVLDLPRQEEQYFHKLVEYDAQKRNFQLYIQSLEALEKYITTIGNSKTDKLLPPSFYIEPGDDYLRSALSKLYAMQMSRNENLFGATELNNHINELDQNIELLRKNILTYIDNSKKGLRQKIADVEMQIADYTSIIKTVPKTQRDLLTIQRKLDVNERMYEYLLEKRASTLIARAGILPETSIIETAHSIGMIKPNKKKISYYFILVGSIIGLIIIFLRTTLFYKIQSFEELRKLTALPILGEIIQNAETDNTNYVIVDKNPKAPITESFRVIRTNLEYMASEVGPKVILITSYNPGEGKTFCSVNLATILAKASKKVLLIELDLHKPKVQKALSMTSDIGISSILIGKVGIKDCILETPIENLDAILSGPTPPNASEIILSKHLAEVFEYGRNNYDYVIVDTAPIGLITDALVIMKYVDISLFVLNTKFANKKVISITQEIVDANKLTNFGLILNGVKRKRSRYYYNYNYGYGYGYGYSYGSGGYKDKGN